ncbi:MAG: hypothetical protein OEZ06_07680 [Myxococcales bacterium]|nr:hypothetical protein [Myxococcales bacterium]
MKRALLMNLFALYAAGCGSIAHDALDEYESCQPGTETGETCSCKDGSEGVEICAEGAGLLVCDCSGLIYPDRLASGSSGDSGTANSGDEPGGGDQSGGSGDGSGGDESGSGGATAGGQNSPCSTDDDCEAGLGCYSGGYCSALCTSDDDCAGLTGGDHSCSTGSGVCRVADCVDDGDCPDELACSGAGTGTARCNLPADEGNAFDPTTIFGGAGGGNGTTTSGGGAQNDPCTTNEECGAGLVCYTFGGHCSASCASDADCASIPGASFTCYTDFGDPVCRVECTLDFQCPDGLSCVDTGFGTRCGYN